MQLIKKRREREREQINNFSSINFKLIKICHIETKKINFKLQYQNKKEEYKLQEEEREKN